MMYKFYDRSQCIRFFLQKTRSFDRLHEHIEERVYRENVGNREAAGRGNNTAVVYTAATTTSNEGKEERE